MNRNNITISVDLHDITKKLCNLRITSSVDIALDSPVKSRSIDPLIEKFRVFIQSLNDMDDMFQADVEAK
jgi:hypothetical protein